MGEVFLFMKRSGLRKLAFAAVLTAMQIVLSRFLGIQSSFFQTSFGFTAVATASAVLGPVWGVVVAIVSDIIGVMLAGTGPWFPLFSVNEILYALLYGFFLQSSRRTSLGVVLCVIIQAVFVAIPLTPLWLYIYFKYVIGSTRAFSVIFMSKITASLIEMPIKMAVLIPMSRFLFPRLEKLFERE